jgi:hypothetical protein
VAEPLCVQVVQAALEVMSCITRTFPVQFQGVVETLFPRLVSHVAASNAVNAAKAKEIAVSLTAAYNLNDSIMWCTKTLLNTPEVRALPHPHPHSYVWCGAQWCALRSGLDHPSLCELQCWRQQHPSAPSQPRPPPPSCLPLLCFTVAGACRMPGGV